MFTRCCETALQPEGEGLDEREECDSTRRHCSEEWQRLCIHIHEDRHPKPCREGKGRRKAVKRLLGQVSAVVGYSHKEFGLELRLALNCVCFVCF